MYTTTEGALIFTGLITLALLFYGITGFLRSELNLQLFLRLFYFIRIPYGRIQLAGASATVASIGCLIPGMLLGLLTIAFLLHKVAISAEILLGLAFVAILVASLGMMLAFVVKFFTGR